MPHDRHQKKLESLKYIQNMLSELRGMAEAERCDMLAYLIEMAYVESSDIIRGHRPLNVQHQQRNTAA